MFTYIRYGFDLFSLGKSFARTFQVSLEQISTVKRAGNYRILRKHSKT